MVVAWLLLACGADEAVEAVLVLNLFVILLFNQSTPRVAGVFKQGVLSLGRWLDTTISRVLCNWDTSGKWCYDGLAKFPADLIILKGSVEFIPIGSCLAEERLRLPFSKIILIKCIWLYPGHPFAWCHQRTILLKNSYFVGLCFWLYCSFFRPSTNCCQVHQGAIARRAPSTWQYNRIVSQRLSSQE